jgi:hypothetical protein
MPNGLTRKKASYIAFLACNTPIEPQEFRAMENGFFVIPLPIVAACADGLARFFRFAPARSFRPIQAAFFLIAASLYFDNFAQAAQVRTVITGTFSQGTDNSGTFVPPPYIYGNLTGKAYTLVFEMDDDPKKSVPYYGTWPASCTNGVENSGLNTPVPHAILTVNGKSYSFGVRPATFISSSAYSLNATVPKTQISTYFYQTRFDTADPSLWGFEAAQVNIYLESIYKCRSWESAFSYALVPSKGDHYDGQVAVSYRNLNSGAIYTNFSAYMNVTTVSVTGPITAPKTTHLFFFDAAKQETFDVTNTTVPVVVGQPIYVFAIPGGTPVQPKAWEVKGNPIGKYLGSSYLPPSPNPTPSCPPSFSPPPECVQLNNPASECVPETTPPDFGQDLTQFYWTNPGFYRVQYHSVSDSAAATFSVLGPTNVNVLAKPSDVAIIASIGCSQPVKSVVWGTETTEFIGQQSFTPGISFLAQADAPGPPGKPTPGEFQWEQLITGETITIDGKAEPSQTGLDNSFFYLWTASLDPKSKVNTNNFAYDAPSISLGNATTVTRNLTGEMFLMWRPSMPDSIPVTLGYVEWHTFFGADLGTRDSTFADSTAYPFVKENNYPTWDKVAKNSASP